VVVVVDTITNQLVMLVEQEALGVAVVHPVGLVVQEIPHLLLQFKVMLEVLLCHMFPHIVLVVVEVQVLLEQQALLLVVLVEQEQPIVIELIQR
jgi:hypothetical protein